MKKIVLLAFVLMFLPTAVVVGFIKPVAAEETIYIKSAGSVVGTDKIQPNGNVYTFTANIYDSIVVERDNIVIDGAGYTLQGAGTGIGIYLSYRSNVTIKNMQIEAFDTGIHFEECSDNTLVGNDITNNSRGMWLGWSSNNTIFGNNITNNTYYGIMLEFDSNYTNISRNNITNNVDGIQLFISSNSNSISGNNITNNTWHGIWLRESSYNSISGNSITESQFGILLNYSSSYNRISGNDITNNSYGIRLDRSSSNTIYHNNLINNTQQVRFYESGYTNVWDDGYPSGGNYWSNYTGIDFYSGLFQNEAGSDGIGDTPYLTGADNQDGYPLMGPFTEFHVPWEGQSFYVDAISNSTISEFHFSQSDRLISFNVTGREETMGFCRVTIPKKLMWCDALEDWNVTVDSNQPICLKTMEDANCTYLYFTYGHTIRKVKITSTHVIGEVPPPVEEEIPIWMEWWFWTIVTAGIVVLAGAVYFLKKRKPKTANTNVSHT